MKPIGNQTKNVRCVHCNKWIRIPGWVKTKSARGKRYKDAIIRCPHCKKYIDITLDMEKK